MTNTLETRFVISDLSVRAGAGDDLRLNGRGASFGVLSAPLDGFREILERNCFDRTLRQRDPDDDDYDSDLEDVKLLRDHDPSMLLARTGNSSLKLFTDDRGLCFSARLNPKIQMHRDCAEAVRSGLIRACSFAFRIAPGEDSESWDEAMDDDNRCYVRRTIRNCDLYDVSILSGEPAYKNATSVDARHANVCIAPDEVLDRMRLARARAIGDQISREERARIPVTDSERREKWEHIAAELHAEQVQEWLHERFPK